MVSLSITRRCGLHMASFYGFFVNIYSQSRFYPHISVHHATSLHCVECTKQVSFDHATSIRFVDQTFLHSTYLKEVAFSVFRMLFIGLLQQSYFSKLRWPHIFLNSIPPFSHRPITLKHTPNRLPQYLHIQPQTPLTDILCIQLHHFFEVRYIASAADLPHSCEAGAE